MKRASMLSSTGTHADAVIAKINERLDILSQLEGGMKGDSRGSHSVMPRRKESKPYLKAMSLSQRSTRLSLQVLMLLKSKKKKMVKMVIIRPQRKHKPQPKIKLSQSRETVPKQRKSPRVKKSTRERGRGGAFWRG